MGKVSRPQMPIFPPTGNTLDKLIFAAATGKVHLSPKRQQEICSFDVSRKTSSLNPVKMHHYTSCLGFMFKLKFKQPLYVGVPEVWVTSATFCIDGSGLARTKHALLSMACPHKR